MKELEKFEKDIKKKRYSKSVYDTIKDTFTVGVKEVSETVSKIFDAPNKGKRQIDRELDRFENNLIKEKYENED